MDLYPYQQEDVEKLLKQRNGLIGSEMGTGKTHEAIALDQEWYDKAVQRPTLVVAPLNTFDSWQEKYAVQEPTIDVVTIDRKNRYRFAEDVRRRRGDVFLMHWEALRLLPELQKIEFGTIIADEVHRAANRSAQQTQALKLLNGVHRLGLSGTASGDRPENLWSVLNWLWPTFYRSYWAFRKHYCIEEVVVQRDERGMPKINPKTGQIVSYRQITGVKNVPQLLKQMEPWYVRHLKRDPCCAHHPQGVMSWLPDKTYETVWVDLNSKQRRIYEQMRKEMVAWVGEHEENPLTASIVAAQLVRLGQISLATPEVRVETKKVWVEDLQQWVLKTIQHVTLHEPSSKIDACKEIISDHPEKSFVVFTSSKKAAYLLHDSMQRSSLSAEVLSGDTPQSSRTGMVARFQEREFQTFIGVIQAAGEGIDGLQSIADTAVYLDRTQSARMNAQSEDRLHRGGQKDTVQIIDIMARNTIDLGRKTKLEKKWAWIKELLGDNAQKKIMEGLL